MKVDYLSDTRIAKFCFRRLGDSRIRGLFPAALPCGQCRPEQQQQSQRQGEVGRKQQYRHYRLGVDKTQGAAGRHALFEQGTVDGGEPAHPLSRLQPDEDAGHEIRRGGGGDKTAAAAGKPGVEIESLLCHSAL